MPSIRFLGLSLKVFNRIGGVSNQMKILKKREFFKIVETCSSSSWVMGKQIDFVTFPKTSRLGHTSKFPQSL